jgi:hypothetical protein
METLKIKKNKPLLVRMADQLLKDQQQLDEMAIQFALGKTEVKAKFELAKKQLKESIQEFKEDLSADYKLAKEKVNAIKLTLEELTEQLEKGRADTKHLFLEQKKNILHRLEEVSIEIRKNPEVVKIAVVFMTALEKIKLQMDLFEKKMNEEKKELTRDFKAEMYDAQAKINSIKAKIKARKEEVDLKMDHFNDEIHLAYSHLKKAIQAL